MDKDGLLSDLIKFLNIRVGGIREGILTLETLNPGRPCPRCGRNHSGPCGIPPTVTKRRTLNIPLASNLGFSISAVGKNVVKNKGGRRFSSPIYPKIEEPHIDVIPGRGRVEVIVEMPGVEEKSLIMEIKGTELVLEGSGPRRHFKTTVNLPFEVGDTKIERRYQNGIFTLEFKKRPKS